MTGAPLALKDLVQLKFSKNSDGAYFCPVTYKVFTDNTKIAAVATTGNVFAYDAIDELNVKTKNWTVRGRFVVDINWYEIPTFFCWCRIS